MRNKRGWIRILEATIAVMLVSSVLLAVYINQQPEQFVTSGDYIYNLQRQLLADISSRPDLRGYVLDEDQVSLDSYIDTRIPSAFGYSLKICNLNETGVCKLNTTEVIETKERSVFAEEAVISANFDDGYSPKKIRLFVWENR